MVNRKRKKYVGLTGFLTLTLIVGCGEQPEYTRTEIEAMRREAEASLINRTVWRPGGRDFKRQIGRPTPLWRDTLTSDPKTFNLIIAETDRTATTILSSLLGYLFDYDPYSRSWKPLTCEFQVEVNEKADTLDVIGRVRDDLYWSTADGRPPVKVTADDIVFWYNEVMGDKELNMSAYSGRFVTLANGDQAEVTCRKLSEDSFVFHFPRIIANPILSCNMMFGPYHVFGPAKDRGGVQAMRELFGVDDDVRSIPSIGPFHLIEYTPGVRLVYQANPNYYHFDAAGNPVPYIEKYVSNIIPDRKTELLRFQSGQTEAYGLDPEDLEPLLDAEVRDYTVFRGGPGIGSDFISFNQNSINADKPYYRWFTQTKFRQAMSCLVDRQRMISEIYRDLGQPRLSIFSELTLYYNPEIINRFIYDPERARDLLAEIGFYQDRDGVMRDDRGVKVEFEIITNQETRIRGDKAAIFAAGCAAIGINVRVKLVDFQRLVDVIQKNFDWQALILGFGSGQYWPTSGSNVWLSSANLHVWHPNQKEPATEWEARIDTLYNEGSFTVDPEKAQKIWDEFNRILLEELPLIHLIRRQNFAAIRDKWANTYFDIYTGLTLEALERYFVE